jgi:hypothetical protein
MPSRPELTPTALQAVGDCATCGHRTYLTGVTPGESKPVGHTNGWADGRLYFCPGDAQPAINVTTHQAESIGVCRECEARVFLTPSGKAVPHFASRLDRCPGSRQSAIVPEPESPRPAEDMARDAELEAELEEDWRVAQAEEAADAQADWQAAGGHHLYLDESW